jgi:hypothetical protein
LQKHPIFPFQELEYQLLHSEGARRPASHSAQRPSDPHCEYRGGSEKHPSKTGNSIPKAEGEKRGNLHHNKNHAFPADHALRKTAGVLEEKTQNPNYKQNSSRCVNLNAE